ncbi:MAG TPA: hypothetical protein VHY35_01675 [Stellaceae bacterium]|jgi:hypothetical protein|nr:hypothetical protein [Stellaceae bacterium]
MNETVPVAVTVRQVIALPKPGRLRGLAGVELDIDGIIIGLHGLRIVRAGTGLGVEAPCWQHRGRAVAAVSMPAALQDVVADEVLAVYRSGFGTGSARSPEGK